LAVCRRRFADNLELGRSARRLVVARDVVFRRRVVETSFGFEKSPGQGAEFHGRRNLIVGRVTDVDALHHGSVGSKALCGIEY
jgi:hypothetical protein